MFEVVTRIQQKSCDQAFVEQQPEWWGVGLTPWQQIKGLTDKSLHGCGWLLGGEPPSL